MQSWREPHSKRSPEPLAPVGNRTSGSSNPRNHLLGNPRASQPLQPKHRQALQARLCPSDRAPTRERCAEAFPLHPDPVQQHRVCRASQPFACCLCCHVQPARHLDPRLQVVPVGGLHRSGARQLHLQRRNIVHPLHPSAPLVPPPAVTVRRPQAATQLPLRSFLKIAEQRARAWPRPTTGPQAEKEAAPRCPSTSEAQRRRGTGEMGMRQVARRETN
mmetsp:Transcript_45236/g.98142  ORF Transcript_45236/g.98142 Transcript_45236/m.98142 type:complete len:218 (+) Transcript_45236:781-1434(+)